MCAKHVSFGTIEIIEFPITLGDNPAVSSGPPLTIEWEPQQRIRFDLDLFEEYRPERRHRRQLPIDPIVREDVLIASGIELDQLLRWQDLSAENDVQKAKKQSFLTKSLKKARRLSDFGARQKQSVQKLQKMDQTLFKLGGLSAVDQEKQSIRF